DRLVARTHDAACLRADLDDPEPRLSDSHHADGGDPCTLRRKGPHPTFAPLLSGAGGHISLSTTLDRAEVPPRRAQGLEDPRSYRRAVHTVPDAPEWAELL